MGWKTIKGHRYYYMSERVGGRVQTTYFGAGGTDLEFRAIFDHVDEATGEGQVERTETCAQANTLGVQ